MAASLLDVLSRQHDGVSGHLQMKAVADAVVLSESATTRLVTRLEDRGLIARYLCPTDRRGFRTDVSEAGLTLLAEAPPHYRLRSPATGLPAFGVGMTTSPCRVHGLGGGVTSSGGTDRPLIRGTPNDSALREALDEAAVDPQLAPLVRVVESMNLPA